MRPRDAWTSEESQDDINFKQKENFCWVFKRNYNNISRSPCLLLLVLVYIVVYIYIFIYFNYVDYLYVFNHKGLPSQTHESREILAI